MQRPAEPPPAAAKCLAAIKAIQAAGEHPSLDRLANRLGVSKQSVKDTLDRLKSGGWITFRKFRPGFKRSITVKG